MYNTILFTISINNNIIIIPMSILITNVTTVMMFVTLIRKETKKGYKE